MPVFVLDWEICHLGVRPVDVGQTVAELYRIGLVRDDIDAGRWMLEGFAAGYGFVDDDFAFRALLHAGAFLVVSGVFVVGWDTHPEGHARLAAAKELVLRAWNRDHAWFEATELACLFVAE